MIQSKKLGDKGVNGKAKKKFHFEIETVSKWALDGNGVKGRISTGIGSDGLCDPHVSRMNGYLL